MTNWIERGTAIEDVSIGRLLNSGTSWQLYQVSDEGSCLVVTDELLAFWNTNYGVSRRLFSKVGKYNAIISSPDMLIACFDSGPYTTDYEIANLVSLACKEVYSKYHETNFNSPLVILDYGLVLPSNEKKAYSERKLDASFKNWLAGGVKVEDSFSRNSFHKLVNWLDSEEFDSIMENIDIKTPESKIATIEENPQDGNEESFNIPAEAFYLPGRRAFCQFLNDNIIDVLRNYSKYKKMGFDFPGGTILYGTSGTGKTYAIEKLSEYLGWPRFDLSAETVASSYVHDTSKKISSVFSHAMKNAPSILVIDEMEAFLSARSNNESKYHLEETAEFLRGLPKLVASHVLIFGMTNILGSLDPAAIRRGRFDYKLELELPDYSDVLDVLRYMLKDIPTLDIDYPALAKLLINHSLSDISFVVKEAGRLSIRANKTEIAMEFFMKAIEELAPNIDSDSKTIGFKV